MIVYTYLNTKVWRID